MLALTRSLSPFNSAAWEKQRAKPKIVTESEVREESPPDATLACPICSKLFSQAVETPCCSTTYCEECIQAHLLEHDFICPGCDSKLEGLDGLKEDKEMRERVQMFIAEEIERRSSGEEKASSDDDKNKVGWIRRPRFSLTRVELTDTGMKR